MINLGGLFFTLDADTKGLQAAERRLNSFGQSITSAVRSSKGAIDDTAAALIKQERLAMSVLEKIKRMQDQIGRSNLPQKQQTQYLDQIGRAYDNFTRKVAGGNPLNALDFSRRSQQITSQLNDVGRAFSAANAKMKAPSARSWMDLTDAMSGLGSASLLVTGHFGGMSTRLFALTTMIRDFGTITAVAAGGLVGMGTALGLVVTKAVEVARTFEGTTKAFEAVTGSSAGASEAIEFVKKAVDSAGLTFNESAKSYSRFLAASKTAGMSLKDTETVFKNTSMAAGRLQLSVEDTQGVFIALEQMLSKGKVQSEELRKQLGNRLPGAFGLAAQAMGVSTQRLEKMLRTGQVLSQDFLPKFAAILPKAFAFDPDGRIDSLTASMNRLANQWQFFLINFDQATKISRVWKATLEAATTVLSTLATNMTNIIGVVGGVVGAFVALGAVLLAPAIVGAVLVFGQWVATIIQLAATVRSLSAAMALLNAVMMKNPFVVLAYLAVALGGAIIGFNLFKSAAESASGAMEDTSAIEQYIAQQDRLLTKTTEVTDSLITQAAAQAQLARTAADAAFVKLGKAQVGGNSITDWIKGGFDPVMAADIRKKRIQGLEQDFHETYDAAQKWEGLGDKLNKLRDKQVNLPDAVATVDEGKVHKMSDNINRIEDILVRAVAAKHKMQELAKGPKSLEFIDDQADALAAVNQMNALQRARTAKALGIAKTDVNSLAAALTPYITMIRQANEATTAFARIWEDINKEQRLFNSAQDQVAFLQVGGNPAEMGRYKAAEDAAEALRKITGMNDGEDKDKLLAAIPKRLAEIGIQANSAQEGLTELFQRRDDEQGLVKVLTDINNAFIKINDATAKANALTSAYAVSADRGEAAQRAIARGEAVQERVRQLRAVNTSQEDINKAVEAYLALLRQQDDATYRLSKTQEVSMRARDAIRQMATDGLDAFKDLISGVKSLNDALRDIATSVLDNMWKQYVAGPAMDALDSLMRKKGEAGVKGLDTGVAFAAASTASPALTAMTAAAYAAMTALNNLAVAAGGKSAGGGGIFGTILNAGASLLGIGSSGVDSGLSAGFQAGGKYTQPLFGSAGLGDLQLPGRAFGGRVHAGNMYQINEQGVNGEYFIPDVSGYMVPSSSNTGTAPAVHIDMSTRIDARGATADAIAQLRAEMATREQNLRRELPLVIDQRVTDSRQRLRP